MYEAQHATTIIRLSARLQHEMARGFNPDRDAIKEICKEIAACANAIEAWARGDDNGQT